MFDGSVGSFSSLFGSEQFLFIFRGGPHEFEFVESRIAALGISNASVVKLEVETSGQAETVFLGLGQEAQNEDVPLTIFNIDTFRPGYRHDATYGHAPSLLEVFRGTGPNWSYVRPSNSVPGKVIETAEKNPISNLCCTGLYRFSSPAEFSFAFAKRKRDSALSRQETYVAPLYNYLLESGKNVYYNEIDVRDVVFCGIPAEYEYLVNIGYTG